MTDCFWCSGKLNGEGVCEECGSRLQEFIDDGHSKSVAKRLDIMQRAAANGETETTS